MVRSKDLLVVSVECIANMEPNQALPDLFPTIFIPTTAVIAIFFGIWLWQRVSTVSLTPGQMVFRSQNGREYLLEEEQRGDDEVRIVCSYWQLRIFLTPVLLLTGGTEGGRHSRSNSRRSELVLVYRIQVYGCLHGEQVGLVIT